MAKPPNAPDPLPLVPSPTGQRCTSPRGRRLVIASHDARLTAHAAQAAEEEEPT